MLFEDWNIDQSIARQQDVAEPDVKGLIEFDFDNNNNVKKSIVKRKEKKFEIFSKVVIAADGCESTSLKLLNLYHPKKGDLA